MISEAYRQEQAKLHENPDYGVASIKYAPIVSKLINALQITDVLDYGAGKGNLAKSLQIDHECKVTMYEPSNPELADKPDSAQLVTCIDVLEHIEPEYLEEVFDDLQRCVEFYGFFTVHTGPAKKLLSDGRNAHLTQKPSQWWLPRLVSRFELVQFQSAQHGFQVLVRPYQ